MQMKQPASIMIVTLMLIGAGHVCRAQQEPADRGTHLYQPSGVRVHGPAASDEALVADDAAGEAHQDRCEGRGAFPVRGLSDGGGRRAQATVPGDPGTDSTVVPPGHWSGAFGMIGGGVHLH